MPIFVCTWCTSWEHPILQLQIWEYLEWFIPRVAGLVQKNPNPLSDWPLLLRENSHSCRYLKLQIYWGQNEILVIFTLNVEWILLISLPWLSNHLKRCLFKRQIYAEWSHALCFSCSDNLDLRVKLEGITCYPNLIPALRLHLIKTVNLTPGGTQDSRISFRYFRIPFPFNTFKQSKLFSNFLSLLKLIVLKFEIEEPTIQVRKCKILWM